MNNLNDRIFLFFLLLLLALAVSVSSKAQETSAIFTGGSVQIGYDNSACTSTNAGMIRYNSSGPGFEFCDGGGWQTSEPSPATGGSFGYFVLSNTGHDGNFGGLTGANSQCLTTLQSQNWLGKTGAGTLTAARVKAFLCDSTNCNNLQPDTTYFMAVAGNTTDGGTLFVTDSNGAGPGYSSQWNTLAAFFNAAHYLWTNRATGSSTLWGTTPHGTNHCLDWSDNTFSNNGETGHSSNAGTGRWQQGTRGCQSSIRFICFVDPE